MNNQYTYRIFTDEHGVRYRLLDDPDPFGDPAETRQGDDRAWRMPYWCPVCQDFSGSWSWKYAEKICDNEALRKPRKWANLKERRAVVPVGPLQAPLVTSQDRTDHGQSIDDIDCSVIDREVEEALH